MFNIQYITYVLLTKLNMKFIINNIYKCYLKDMSNLLIHIYKLFEEKIQEGRVHHLKSMIFLLDGERFPN